VEVLEGRELLSTAGVVSRPAAAVAPLARFAQISSIAGDPEYSGTFSGTGPDRSIPGIARWSTNGMVVSSKANSRAGQAFTGVVQFNGAANSRTQRDGTIIFTHGIAALINPLTKTKLDIGFKGSEIRNKIKLEGENLHGLNEMFKGISPFTLHPKGTFSATGHIIPATGTIEFKFKIHLTKV
jgi:hypothetical protein